MSTTTATTKTPIVLYGYIYWAHSTTYRPWFAKSLCRGARLLHCRSQITQYDCSAGNWLNVVNCSKLHSPVKGFVVSCQQRFVIRQLPVTYAQQYFRQQKKIKQRSFYSTNYIKKQTSEIQDQSVHHIQERSSNLYSNVSSQILDQFF